MKTFSLLLCCLSIGSFLIGQNLSTEEQQLYDQIMQYRAQQGLPRISLSPSLTYVAQMHVRDMEAHYNDVAENAGCNLHSWSNQGSWTTCCYTSDHAQAACMWDKPRELTAYQGDGYEISFATTGVATARVALATWQRSPGHNSLLINQGIWQQDRWQAIGIGIFGGHACVWFGKELDR